MRHYTDGLGIRWPTREIITHYYRAGCSLVLYSSISLPFARRRHNPVCCPGVQQRRHNGGPPAPGSSPYHGRLHLSSGRTREDRPQQSDSAGHERACYARTSRRIRLAFCPKAGNVFPGRHKSPPANRSVGAIGGYPYFVRSVASLPRSLTASLLVRLLLLDSLRTSSPSPFWRNCIVVDFSTRL
jgi:hypothetical protein